MEANKDQTHFKSETRKQIVRQILSASGEEITAIYETLGKTPVNDFGIHAYFPELLPRLAKQYDKSDPGNLIALM
jgi:mannose-6-phosphate isomerase